MGRDRAKIRRTQFWNGALVLLVWMSSAPLASAANMAVSFDGVNDHINIADRSYFSPSVNDLTVAAWVKIPTTATASGNGSCGGTGRYFIAKGASNQWEWAFENDSNARLCFSMWTLSGSGHATINLPRMMNDGNWHHYAATVDYLNRVAVYIDGQEVASVVTFTGTMGNGTQQVQLGRRGDGNYFSGILDEVRIYSRALTAAEITSQFNGGLGQYGGLESGLVAGWHLDEGTGTTAADYSGTGNTGTLVNGPVRVAGLVVAGDTTPPSGTVTINGGATVTNTLTVTLALSATDNSGTVVQMKFSNDGTTYSTPEPYAATKTWTLSTGDGTKTVYVRFADAYSWSNAATDTITLDTTPPVITITAPADGAVIPSP